MLWNTRILEIINSRMWSALECGRNLTNKSQEKCACIDFMYNNKDNLFVCNDAFVSFLQDMLGYDLNEKEGCAYANTRPKRCKVL